MDVFKELQKAMEEAARQAEAAGRQVQPPPRPDELFQEPEPRVRRAESPWQEPAHRPSAWEEPAEGPSAWEEPAPRRKPRPARRRRREGRPRACPACGRPSPARARFCRWCGQGLERPAAAPRPEMPPPEPPLREPTPETGAKPKREGFALRLDRDAALRGILFSEILGPPPGLREEDEP